LPGGGALLTILSATEEGKARGPFLARCVIIPQRKEGKKRLTGGKKKKGQ